MIVDEKINFTMIIIALSPSLVAYREQEATIYNCININNAGTDKIIPGMGYISTIVYPAGGLRRVEIGRNPVSKHQIQPEYGE